MIKTAVLALEQHPLIGPGVKSTKKNRRRLVISRGKSGYVALYRFDARRDMIFVLAVRHQHEAGLDEE